MFIQAEPLSDPQSKVEQLKFDKPPAFSMSPFSSVTYLQSCYKQCKYTLSVV